MQFTDTTNPQAHAGMRTVLSGAADEQALALIRHLYFHVLGMYYCAFGPGWSSDGRRETDYVSHIDIFFSGRLQVVHGRRVLDLEPGHAYFLPANTAVERRYLKRGTVLFLKFRCEWLPGVDPLLDWPQRTPTCLGPVDVAAWRRWLQPGWKDKANHLLQLQAQLETWMAGMLPDLSSLIGRHLETHARFEGVFAQLEAQLGADLRVADLARTYGTSLHTFSTTFSAVTGISPKGYLNRRLNQEALQLVINTDLRVKEIAEKLRFSSEFYFSRFFQKLNGMSPAHYRARIRTGG